MRKHVIMGSILALLLVATAGHLDWYRAWIYVALTTGLPMIAVRILNRRNPDLLRERSRMHKDTKTWDKVLAPLVAFIGPAAIWITAALDVRAAWPPPVSLPASALAMLLCAAGSGLMLRAMLVNSFFSTTVRLQQDRGQVVVDHGPYSVVRHPGYTGAGLFTLATPIALGSKIALIPAALTFAALLLRTWLEDRTLTAELPGYPAYAQKVRSRLVPYLW